MKKFLCFLAFCFFCVSYSYGQEYKTYDEAFEAFKSYSMSKGFSAITAKYKHCKNKENQDMEDVSEEMNEYTGRMDVSVTWNYKYCGCYLGIHKYTGSARVKGYISRTSSGKFKYGDRGVSVLHYDPEK